MKVLIYFLFLVVVFQLFGQKPTVSLSADTKYLQVGEQITFTVKSNVAGGVTIDFPKEFTAGNGTMNGMEQEIDYTSGEVSTIYYFSQNGSFKSNGSFTFYAYVNNRKKIFKSNAITIKVEKQATTNSSTEEEISKRTLKQPVFGLIQRSKTKIYEGEPVVLEAKIYSKLNINMLQEYASFEVEGGAEMKEIDKSQRLLMSKVAFKGQNYLTFTYGKQVVFPSQLGKVKIKPFEMSLQYDNGSIFSEQISFVSNSSMIEVLPLPDGAPKDFIGGVGVFDLRSELNKHTGNIGEVAELKITISGQGNLHNISKPKINLPKQLSLYGDPEIDEQISYSEKGAEGSITYTYHIRLEQDGKASIPPVSIAYFSPDKKKYIQVKQQAQKIEILSSNQTVSVPVASQIEPLEEDKQVENIPLFSSASNYNNGAFYQSVYFWPSVISPFFLAFLGVFFFQSKRKEEQQVEAQTYKRKLSQKIQQVEDLVANASHLPQTERIQLLENILKSLGETENCAITSCCTKLELFDILRNQRVSEEHLTQLKRLFVSCEEMKYAFDDQSTRLSQVLMQAQKLLKELV